MSHLAKKLDSANSFLCINIDLIISNYMLLKKKLGKAACAATLKADAYGIGAAKVGPALVKAGCSSFFVATIDEAIDLRNYIKLKHIKIAVLSGFLPKTEPIFNEYDIIPVINNLDQLRDWKKYNSATGKSLNSVLQIDTGMNRLGLTANELYKILDNPTEINGANLCGLMSHLACSDEPDHEMNQKQLLEFIKAKNKLPRMETSLANSGGIFLGKSYHFDLARPGIALYGATPNYNACNPLKQAIKLYGRVLQIRETGANQTVGYGASYKPTRDSVIATVGVGYADGYLRSLSSNSYAFFNNIKIPIIGRVSMDCITVDISSVPTRTIKPGDFIEVMGDNFTIDDIAKAANTVPHEILSGLGTRHFRQYYHSSN
jgi:alanine racemase